VTAVTAKLPPDAVRFRLIAGVWAMPRTFYYFSLAQGGKMSSDTARNPIYWSFSGPDSWRMSVPRVSTAFVGDPELIAELEKQAKPVTVAPGRTLFRQGDAPAGVYIVKKGAVTLKTRSDGDAVLNVQAGAGSLLGLPAVVGAQPYSLTAEAQEGAEVVLLSSEDFVHLMCTDPRLSFRVLQVLAAEVRFAREAISHL
jgi:CRP-like cAMP-binding protein